MHKYVDEFIEQQKAAKLQEDADLLRVEQEIEQEKRINILRQVGFIEKVYFDGNGDFNDEEYPHCEWDPVSQSNRYYKEIPYDITDEEYAEILKYVPSEVIEEAKADTNPPSGSAISLALKFFAGIEIIGGAITGIALADIGYEFNFALMLGIWAGCGLAGCLLLGFAKVIDLLQDIRDKE